MAVLCRINLMATSVNVLRDSLDKNVRRKKMPACPSLARTATVLGLRTATVAAASRTTQY